MSKLYILAGYRASGKTTALRLANDRDDFPLFPPESMADFKRIRGAEGAPKSNSGFYSYHDVHEMSSSADTIAGVHFDFILPIQNMMRRMIAARDGSGPATVRTPQLWTKMLKTALEDGSIAANLRGQFEGLTKLRGSFHSSELSVLHSNWDTNRKGYLERLERQGKKPLDELRRQMASSFNIALFDHDLEFGRRLHEEVHRAWFEFLRNADQPFSWMTRNGPRYDLVYRTAAQPGVAAAS